MTGTTRSKPPNLVPSVVEFLARPDLAGRIGARRPLERIALIGQTALIGRPALNRN
jgi:hypothetical protein